MVIALSKRKISLILSIVTILIFTVSQSSYARSWSFEIVDSSGNVSGDLSIAWDSHGDPHTPYVDHVNRHLKYTPIEGDSSTTETSNTVEMTSDTFPIVTNTIEEDDHSTVTVTSTVTATPTATVTVTATAADTPTATVTETATLTQSSTTTKTVTATPTTTTVTSTITGPVSTVTSTTTETDTITGSVTTTTQTITKTTTNTLDGSVLRIRSDESEYAPGNQVVLTATLEMGTPNSVDDNISGVFVALTVTDPDGSLTISRTAQTDDTGSASISFVLPSSAIVGKYTVSASASYRQETLADSTSFTVRFSSPEIAIT